MKQKGTALTTIPTLSAADRRPGAIERGSEGWAVAGMPNPPYAISPPPQGRRQNPTGGPVRRHAAQPSSKGVGGKRGVGRGGRVREGGEADGEGRPKAVTPISERAEINRIRSYRNVRARPSDSRRQARHSQTTTSPRARAVPSERVQRVARPVV